MARNVFIVLAMLFCGGCSEFMEYDLSNLSVEVLAPANGIETDSREIRFGWYPVEGATGYKVIIVAPSFANAEKVVADTMVVGTGYIHVVDSDGRYEWGITPCNSAYRGITKKYYFTVNTAKR